MSLPCCGEHVSASSPRLDVPLLAYPSALFAMFMSTDTLLVPTVARARCRRGEAIPRSRE
eukprot:scaffold185_cov321-Prasinococcus_capsulatus_cf.AAC.5